MITVDEIIKVAHITKEAVELLEAGVDAARKAFEQGTAKLNEAKAKLAKFEERIAAGDAAADAALDRKFDK